MSRFQSNCRMRMSRRTVRTKSISTLLLSRLIFFLSFIPWLR